MAFPGFGTGYDVGQPYGAPAGYAAPTADLGSLPTVLEPQVGAVAAQAGTSAYAGMSFDQIVHQLQQDKAALSRAQDSLPQWMKDMFATPAFLDSCLDEFDQLDLDGKQFLTWREMTPLLRKIAGNQNVYIRDSDAQKLLELFDEDNNGIITRTEHLELVKFLFVISYLTEQEKARTDVRSSQVMSVHEMLNMMQQDKEALDKMTDQIPQWIKDKFSSPEFIRHGLMEFDRLDRTKNGKLTPGELSPLLVELCRANAAAVTIDQCLHLVAVFDLDNDGVISRDEYVKLCKFLFG
mmetsp:Transcript_62292/g.143423  ORF Transcript_62292/g.143423 Transcript_62292/m.143423 type:complete len:294 (+) Transcript_62292:1-882(+)